MRMSLGNVCRVRAASYKRPCGVWLLPWGAPGTGRGWGWGQWLIEEQGTPTPSPTRQPSLTAAGWARVAGLVSPPGVRGGVGTGVGAREERPGPLCAPKEGGVSPEPGPVRPRAGWWLGGSVCPTTLLSSRALPGLPRACPRGGGGSLLGKPQAWRPVGAGRPGSVWLQQALGGSPEPGPWPSPPWVLPPRPAEASPGFQRHFWGSSIPAHKQTDGGAPLGAASLGGRLGTAPEAPGARGPAAATFHGWSQGHGKELGGGVSASKTKSRGLCGLGVSEEVVTRWTRGQEASPAPLCMWGVGPRGPAEVPLCCSPHPAGISVIKPGSGSAPACRSPGASAPSMLAG